MSLRNRARRLQEKTGLSYQQALDRLRKLGKRPADLAKQTGWTLETCDRFLIDGHAKIEVIETRQPLRQHLLDELCEWLRQQANARTVLLAEDSGRILSHVGATDVAHAVFLRTVTGHPRQAVVKTGVPEVWELDGDLVLAMHKVRPRAMLVVKFHKQETSLGLVRLRMKKVAVELERLLAEDVEMPPPGGSSGPSGAPAEARVGKPRRRRGE
jgi:hypothetical protein